MTDGPVAVATRGKGALNLIQRAGAIGVRYGLGPTRMERRLEAVLQAVRDFGCGATLPITAAAVVERNPAVVARFASEGIEFAGHGYYHVDHAVWRGPTRSGGSEGPVRSSRTRVCRRTASGRRICAGTMRLSTRFERTASCTTPARR
jgi:hypothetical protein